jgi:hypothetical protein
VADVVEVHTALYIYIIYIQHLSNTTLPMAVVVVIERRNTRKKRGKINV